MLLIVTTVSYFRRWSVLRWTKHKLRSQNFQLFQLYRFSSSARFFSCVKVRYHEDSLGEIWRNAFPALVYLWGNLSENFLSPFGSLFFVACLSSLLLCSFLERIVKVLTAALLASFGMLEKQSCLGSLRTLSVCSAATAQLSNLVR